MKKKSEKDFLNQILPPVKLYFDDLDGIVQEMQKVCSEVNISTEDYEFESLEDLKENSGDKIKELSITGNGGSIILDIQRYKVWLNSWGESGRIAGLWYSLREVLLSKANWYYGFLNPWIWGVILGALALFTDKIKKSLPEIEKGLPVVLGIISFFFLLSLLNRWKGSTIYLERKHKVSNFWERNKDNIIMIIIGGFIGWFLKILYEFIFK